MSLHKDLHGPKLPTGMNLTKHRNRTDKPRARIILTAEQAAEIYSLKNFCLQGSKHRGYSLPIAKKYGVSPKTIRDIWNRQTWTFATVHLLPIIDGVTSQYECEVSLIILLIQV